MQKIYNTVILLVKSAITGEKVEIPEDINWDDVLKICKEQQITSIVYYGIENSNLNISGEVKEEFFNIAIQSVMQEQNQFMAFEEISDSFEKNGIDYLPLKGTIIKTLYPKPEMRIMCDMDILIQPSQYSKIRELMLNMGFKEGARTDYELHWHKGFVTMELHECLIPNNLINSDYYKYFGEGWGRAKLVEGTKHKYTYSNEDHFIFVFGHLAKHYKKCGVGIRPLVDIWVMLKKYKSLDLDYITKELKKCELDRFFKNVVETVKVWFEDMPKTEMSDHITKETFENNLHGSKERRHLTVAAKKVQTQGNKENNTLLKIIKTIFMPFSDMKSIFPILKKAPVLLPAMWVVRWINVLIKSPKNISSRFSYIKNHTNRNIDKLTAELDYVGLKLGE